MLKLFGVGALILVMLIPLLMIQGVLNDRLARRNEAVDDITASWGKDQNIIGPVLVVLPYDTVEDGAEIARLRFARPGPLNPKVHMQGQLPLSVRFGEGEGAIKDASLALNGRTGLLNSCLPPGDPRRGWDFRSPGHGGVDWEALVRALNEIGYDGPLSVDWADPDMDRDFGAEDACRFVKRLDFPSAPRREA